MSQHDDANMMPAATMGELREANTNTEEAIRITAFLREREPRLIDFVTETAQDHLDLVAKRLATGADATRCLHGIMLKMMAMGFYAAHKSIQAKDISDMKRSFGE